MAIRPATAPTLANPTATLLEATTATLGAEVTGDGGVAITARGTVWGTATNPTGNQVAEGSTTTGVFTQARTGLTAGTRIYYRGYATNSIGTAYSPNGSFYTEPSAQASGVNFTSVTSTGMTVNWTRGTAGDGVIVLMKAASAVDSDPLDGTYSTYTANAAFGSGTQIGTGNYVVFKGAGTSVAVTGLTSGTTYYVAVYEYKGALDTSGFDQGTNYREAPATGNQTPPGLPTLTTPTATLLEATTATLGANITSNGGATLTARGTVWGTAANPTGNQVAAGGTTTGVFTQARTGLTAGTKIYYRGYATNSVGTAYSPDGSFYTEPSAQASGVNFTNVTSTGMTVNWTRGTAGDGVIVLMKAVSAVDADPADGTYTTYTANTVFGSGAQIGTGNYVIYKGTGTSTSVTGLTKGTTYHVAVYEYKGTVDTAGDNQGTNYRETPATGNQLTLCTESVLSSLTFTGTTATGGNFNGSTFVTATDLNNLQYRVTGTGPATIGTVNAWAQQYNQAGYPAGTINAAYAVGAGSQRLLVVAIASTRTAVGNQTVSVTYGGQALTLAAGDGSSTATWNHSYLYYLDEAGIQAAQAVPDDNLNVTITGGTALYTYVGAAVFGNVNQTTPFTSTQNYNSNAGNTTVGPFNPALTINDGDQAIEVVNLARSTTGTTGRTITTWAAGWETAGLAQAYTTATNTPCFQVYIRNRNVTTAASDGSQHTASNTAFDSMTAMSLKPATVETVLIDWNADPQEAAAVLTNGSSYKLYARGTDTECGLTTYYVGGTTAPGNGQDFTWYTCYDADPSTITIPTGQTAYGTPYNAGNLKTTTGDVGTFEYKVTRTAAPAGPTTTTLYLQGDTTTNLGTDGTANLPTIQSTGTTIPYRGTTSTGATTATSWRPSTLAAGAKVLIRGYSPVYTYTSTLSSISANAALRSTATGDVFTMHLYDYDPATGTKTQIATSNTVTNISNAATTAAVFNTYTLVNGGKVQANHRLMYEIAATTFAGGTTCRVYYGGTTTTTGSWVAVTSTPDPTVTICTNWTATAAIPATAAGGSLCGDYVNLGTYTLEVRGTDPDCGAAITTTPTAFTWNACSETKTLTAPSPAAPITGPVTVTAGGTATGIQVSWSIDGGTNWSAWVANGSTFTPPPCASGSVIFRAQGSGDCATITVQSGAVAYNTNDADLATLTTTPSGTVTGLVVVRAQVGVESAPSTMTNMSVNITGAGACNVSNGVMTWNAGSSRWEYSWDTSACGTGPALSGVTLTTSGNDPDCGNYVTSAATSVTIDNTCIDNTSTVTWTVPGAPITVATAITATGTVGVTAIEVSFDDGGTWQTNGATFTPKVDQLGTAIFRFRALNVCGKRIYGGTVVEGATAPGKAYNVPFDGRLNRIRPLQITAQAFGKTSITVSMNYCSDKNDNAQTTVRYKLTSAPDLPANWTTVGPVIDGQAGDADGLRNQTVQFMLTSLTTDTSYDIEVTVTETAPDVVDWTTIQLSQATAPPWKKTVQLTSWVDSNLMHNALRFACSKIGYASEAACVGAGGTWDLNGKWPGGWGLPNASYPGAQYDAFECGTCHAKNSSNVKRVITAVTAKADTLPGSTVALQDVREGTAEFGDDSDSHTTSNRVCEVCHSQTTYHRQNSSTLTNKLHNNKTDCIRCHEHNVGFRASCDNCHGTPPVSAAGLATQPATTGSTVWGEHQRHAVDLGYDCNTCHNGWDGPNQMPKNGNLNIGFKVSVNPQFTGAVKQILGGTYEGRTTGGGYTGDTSTTPATVVNTASGDMTCAVYCHGYARPVWNPASTQPCGSCHGGIGTGVGYRAGAPTGLTVGGVTSRDLAGLTTGFQVGKHANHLDDSVYQTGDPCALCHDGFNYNDTTHVNGTVNVKLRQAAKLSSPGTTGGAGLGSSYNANRTCTTECHGATSWDSAAILNCTQSCHNYPPVGVTAGYSTYSSGVIKPVNHTTPNGLQYLKDNHGQCLYCHGWNDNGSGALPITGMTAAQLTAMNGDPAEAPNFTTYSSPGNTIGQHMDGTITLNDDGDANLANDADYDPTTGGCDNAVCHGNDTAHQFTIPGGINSPLKAADIGPGDCGACHTTGVGGATIVTSTSPHTTVTKNGTFTGCGSCHSGHYIKAGGVNIPNNATVGINYVGTQHGGIKLGGPGTHASIATKTTEAEICWGCHDAMGTANVKKATITFTATTIVDSGAGLGVFTVGKPLKVMGSSVVANNKWVTPTAVAAGTLTFPAATFTADATAGEMITLQDFVSEWGKNSYQAGAAAASQYQYDYGSLSTSNWTTATWTSGQAKFGYKTSKIQSTHAANSAGASTVTGTAYAYKESPDNVALIRCSYCHDVHDAVGPNGPPYLRGTWWGNPYEEDGAPQAATAYSVTAPFGAVPRGNGANQTYIGGFFIDINNVRPGTAGAAANGTASANPTATGGTGTGGAWTLADSAGLCTLCHGNNPSTMNWNTTETNMWFSANGHANAVIGGTGNVPAGTAANIFDLRGGTLSTTGATNTPAMHYWGGTATTGVAPGDVGTYGFRNGGNSGYNYTPSLSSVSENNEITTPGTNRWGTITIDAATINSQYHKFSCSKCHNPHASRLPKLMITNCLDTKHNTWDDSYQLNASNGAINTNRSISNWSTAQNCHRVGGIIPANRLIPGDSTTGGPTGNGLYAEPVDTGAVEATKGTGTNYSNRGWNTVTPW
ncbi:MAG: hypothetical protein FIB02_01135 [Desulfuromonas sp.]|nr:hypothetical protein [Desulfuromonas sp.]